MRPLPPTERSLPIALIRARERVMAPIRDMLSETGITEQQWRVLRVLSEHADLDATALAERAALLQPSLTRILRTLTERGFITRVQDPSDKRKQVVTLTSEGRSMIASNEKQAGHIAQAMRDTLGDGAFDTLLDLLAQLDHFDPKGSP
ncbi:Transcriptional regulator, MarR family [Sulfitobacter noctilucae]|uniref:homoprotocatechuate degradation operon regulator HpaR n=1 Tax=Sulfitobacter noctilucae TaxID=1342302 RepID=UPI00056441F0|nr:homoprotocatechuate degradation operon regulator HpaR [Sulfitobacter noctilucae]KIN70498.1 Transcriptional regulator, MarR family [Sulfitobacter noctilucae]